MTDAQLAYYLQVKTKDRLRATSGGAVRDGWLNVYEELCQTRDVDKLLNLLHVLVHPSSIYREVYLLILPVVERWQAEFFAGEQDWPARRIRGLRFDAAMSGVTA